MTNYKQRLEARGERSAEAHALDSRRELVEARKYYSFLVGHADLAPIVLMLAEALKSISGSSPDQEDPEYWKFLGVDQCAEVIATDTRLAREAIANLEKYLDGKGD